MMGVTSVNGFAKKSHILIHHSSASREYSQYSRNTFMLWSIKDIQWSLNQRIIELGYPIV